MMNNTPDDEALTCSVEALEKIICLYDRLGLMIAAAHIEAALNALRLRKPHEMFSRTHRNERTNANDL